MPARRPPVEPPTISGGPPPLRSSWYLMAEALSLSKAKESVIYSIGARWHKKQKRLIFSVYEQTEDSVRLVWRDGKPVID